MIAEIISNFDKSLVIKLDHGDTKWITTVRVIMNLDFSYPHISF